MSSRTISGYWIGHMLENMQMASGLLLSVMDNGWLAAAWARERDSRLEIHEDVHPSLDRAEGEGPRFPRVTVRRHPKLTPFGHEN